MQRLSERRCRQTRSKNSRSGPTPTSSRFLPTGRIGSTAGCVTTLSQLYYHSQNLMQRNSTTAKVAFATALLFMVVSSLTLLSRARESETTGQKPLDPAAWGKDHVGKPVPEYVSGDECLFCHRNDIGPGWSKNRHSLTVRQREDAPELVKLLRDQKALAAVDPEITYFMGSASHIRFLKKSGYGKFALLSARADLGADGQVQKLVNAEKLTWD